MADIDHPVKLLFSARDPAAAQAIGNLVKRACTDSRFNVQVISSSPASELLSGLPCKCLALPHVVSTTPGLLLSTVTQIVDQYHPDAIIAGASGPDAGVDEVLVKQARGIRSYVVQDFWGDVNLTLGAPPDCYLVVDRLAAELTQKRVPSEVCVVGSVKHASYGTLNVPLLRVLRRAALGCGENEPVVGYFGMPLGSLPGYWRTLEALGKALQGWPVTLLYRPHPKEDDSVRGRTCSMLNSVDRFTEDQSTCVEETLAACDLILSCYSSCGIDSELLGRNLKPDNRLSIFLLYDTEIRDYYQNSSLLEDLPTSLQKRSLTIKDSALLRETMEYFLSAKSRLDFLGFELALPSSNESIKRVFDKVIADCGPSESTD